MNNTKSRTLAVAILTALGTSSFAGALERAPELPDAAHFREALGAVSVPAVAAGVAVGANGATVVACPVLDLQGATVGRGIFQEDYRVKIGGQVVGKIASEGDGYTYKDSAGNVAAKSTAQGGAQAVTDCSGNKVGSIEETADSSASSFKIRGADGGLIAVTGAIDSDNMEFLDYAGKPVGWVVDGKISITDKLDGRMVAIASVMNDAAAYRRAAQRRRERAGEGRGGRF